MEARRPAERRVVCLEQQVEQRKGRRIGTEMGVVGVVVGRAAMPPPPHHHHHHHHHRRRQAQRHLHPRLHLNPQPTTLTSLS